VTTSFDRLRPRAGASADAVATAADGGARDLEGKRALFSSTAPEPQPPSLGSVSVDCRSCGESTVLSPGAAIRSAIPSLLLSIGVGRGDRESTVGLVRRRYGAFLRCPACGRGSWVRLTVHL
jgi:hypothetical protein